MLIDYDVMYGIYIHVYFCKISFSLRIVFFLNSIWTAVLRSIWSISKSRLAKVAKSGVQKSGQILASHIQDVFSCAFLDRLICL